MSIKPKIVRLRWATLMKEDQLIWIQYVASAKLTFGGGEKDLGVQNAPPTVSSWIHPWIYPFLNFQKIKMLHTICSQSLN